ncbi:hypothetical protein Tco_0445507 [Tanacetum coccineum]
MVISSPCLTGIRTGYWLVQDQTVLGKDYSNLLIADSLLKTIWFINAPCYDNEALASPKANGICVTVSYRRVNWDLQIPLDYSKLNKIYESFVPQTEISAEQTYLSIPSTSNVSSESSLKKSDLPRKKMPKESQLLKHFVNLENEIKALGKLINIHHKMDKHKSFFYDNKADIRRIFTLEVVPISRTLKKCSKEIKQEITTEVQLLDGK